MKFKRYERGRQSVDTAKIKEISMSFLKVGFAMPYRELEKDVHANQQMVRKYINGIL